MSHPDPPESTAPRKHPPRAWDFLPPRCRRVVANLGFAGPTEVQSRCLARALAGESLRITAPTGTGKTLVYLLPLWNSLPARERNLILVPTRELAYQVSQMLQALDPAAREGLVLVVGGHAAEAQADSLRRGWHTVIATPGRLLDLLSSRPQALHALQLLVLDEFDRLLDLGFEPQIRAILSRLPSARQTLLFSATEGDAPYAALGLDALAACRPDPQVKTQLEERFYFLKSNRKKNELLLEALLPLQGQALVFVANREKANHLNGLLRLRGFAAQALHGSRLQRERARAYQDFHDGRCRVLVATDLAARGLDIPAVDLIVNFDLPRDLRDYVHRSGRTARQSRPGVCLSFVGPDDFLALRNLEQGFASPLPAHPDYAQYENWKRHALRVHQAKTKAQNQLAAIHRKQGLKP